MKTWTEAEMACHRSNCLSQCRMMRRTAKSTAKRGCLTVEESNPCVRDILELYYPPMKDEDHLMDGRTLKEAWPEIEAKILALPDDPPEELFQEQLKVYLQEEEWSEAYREAHPNETWMNDLKHPLDEDF